MSLRHAILGVLEFRPLHGYALKSVMEKGIAYVWPVNLPAIYPCLRRLEEEGLVTHHTEATLPGRPDRKVFSVTPLGREELAEWRRLPPEKGLPTAKNPLFLKLLFAKRENVQDIRVWANEALDEALQEAARLRRRWIACWPEAENAS
jgi:DNA-binding PadR family transcriptional regulator